MRAQEPVAKTGLFDKRLDVILVAMIHLASRKLIFAASKHRTLKESEEARESTIIQNVQCLVDHKQVVVYSPARINLKAVLLDVVRRQFPYGS